MRKPERGWVAGGALLLALLVLCGGTAWAHKVKVFATVEGRTIRGYVYFPGGGRARGVKVEVFGPADQKLGETLTNENGEFTLGVKVRCDHRLVVDTPGGHRATYRVGAAELPDDLPPLEGGEASRAAPPTELPRTSGTQPPTSRAAAIQSADVKETIREAVQKAVRPLREQLERLEEKRRLQDILGGIGYILGLAGISFYFLGLRRRKAAPPGDRQASLHDQSEPSDRDV